MFNVRFHLRLSVALATFLFAGGVVGRAQTWNTTADNAAWGTAANWNPTTVPNAANAAAVLGPTIPANRTINVNGSFTIGSLTIDSPNNYLLTNNTLVFSVSTGSGTVNVTNSGSPTIASALSLGTNVVITHSGTGTLSLAGAVSGSGGLTKTGSGLVVLSGSSGNSYSGPTTVQQGELRLSKTSGNAIAGNLTVGNGSNTAIVRLATNNQISDSATVSVNSSGQFLNSGAASDTIGSLNLTGGLVDMGSGTLTLSANPAIIANAHTNSATIAGTLALPGTKTIQVADGAAAVDLDITARLVDSGYTSIIKTGSGTVRLSASNSFQGPLTVSNGVVILANSFALGPSTWGNSVASGAAIHLSGGINLTEGNTDIRGAGPDGAGAFVSISGANTNNGTLTAAQAATIGAASGASLALTGALDLANNLTFTGAGNFNVSAASYGAGNLIKTGAGTLLFSGTATDINGNRLDVLEGTVELNRPGKNLNTAQHPIVGTTSGPAATLRLLTANQIRDDMFVNIYESGTLDLNNFDEGLAGLRLYGGTVQTGTGILTIVNAGGDEIHAYSSGQTATISGNLRSDLAQGITITADPGAAPVSLDISAAFSGSVATVTKKGTGTLVFSGSQANTYTGQTIVDAGTLVLGKTAGVDAIAGSSVRVNPGASLRLAAANQIRNTTSLNLAGGTFITGATAGHSDTLGTLTLSATSTIDLGTGSHQLVFANSSAITWAGTLNIGNWTGSGGSSGTQGQIFFGVGGLTTTQLAQVQFSGFAPGAIILSSGELVPIPETRTFVAVWALALAIMIRERRRIRAFLSLLPLGWRRWSFH